MPEAFVEAQFEDAEQQASAATLGVWVFLATEVLFFGALFLAYIVYRSTYPMGVSAAAKELNVTIGSANTAILLTSSFSMALAVHAARGGKLRSLIRNLSITLALGGLFLVLKAVEYLEDFHENIVISANVKIQGEHSSQARIFYFIYYVMTGVHALHLTVGLGCILWILRRARRNEFSPTYHTPVEAVGLYWHFVDVIWIFLYPLLYLVGRS